MCIGFILLFSIILTLQSSLLASKFNFLEEISRNASGLIEHIHLRLNLSEQDTHKRYCAPRVSYMVWLEIMFLERDVRRLRPYYSGFHIWPTRILYGDQKADYVYFLTGTCLISDFAACSMDARRSRPYYSGFHIWPKRILYGDKKADCLLFDWYMFDIWFRCLLMVKELCTVIKHGNI